MAEGGGKAHGSCGSKGCMESSCTAVGLNAHSFSKICTEPLFLGGSPKAQWQLEVWCAAAAVAQGVWHLCVVQLGTACGVCKCISWACYMTSVCVVARVQNFYACGWLGRACMVLVKCALSY